VDNKLKELQENLEKISDAYSKVYDIITEIKSL